MKVTRVGFVVACIVALIGCGPEFPPAGNYATVAGRVTDATSGSGITGVVVAVNAVLFATTDANGNFKIGNVPTGPWSYAVTSSPTGYLQPPDRSNDTPLAPGEKRTLNISLTHG